MELTVASLIDELGLELASGEDAAQAPVRWVHSTELQDPTPWLRGGVCGEHAGLRISEAFQQRVHVAVAGAAGRPRCSARMRAPAGAGD